MEEKCAVGLVLKEECHEKTWSRLTGFMKFSDLSDHNKESIQLRRGLSLKNADTICFYHEKNVLVRL